MERKASTIKVLVALLCGCLSAVQAHAQQPVCEVYLNTLNANRYVFGSVAAECTYGCPPFHHSHPFGNWGVDSPASNRGDGYQFMGWATYNPYCGETMNTPEWNSCTEYGGGSPSYFNYAGNTQQFSGEERWVGQQVRPFLTDEYAGCTVVDGWTMVFTNNDMYLYELDAPGSDQLVTILSFPDASVTLSCNPVECTDTYGPDVASYANSVASATMRLWAVASYVLQ